MDRAARQDARSIGQAELEPIDILWITAGLGCDGDSIAVTAARQPSLEDLLRGGIPGIPPVRFHHPVFSYEVGADFLKVFYEAAAGKLRRFILVIEGSIPNEHNKQDGYWAAFGTDPEWATLKAASETDGPLLKNQVVSVLSPAMAGLPLG